MQHHACSTLVSFGMYVYPAHLARVCPALLATLALFGGAHFAADARVRGAALAADARERPAAVATLTAATKQSTDIFVQNKGETAEHKLNVATDMV